MANTTTYDWDIVNSLEGNSAYIYLKEKEAGYIY